MRDHQSSLAIEIQLSAAKLHAKLQRVPRRNLAIVTACLILAALTACCEAGEPATDAAGWALRPVRRPAVPPVRDQSWPATAVDRFILAKLESKELRASTRADKATLIRRATFDLHGLPPTPAELDAFSSDDSPNAFANVVDRLLSSPRYGERWGRHWLDVVRFAESHGFEFDRLRENAWRYRDYVIESLNRDKPYDAFVREQLAGDALSPQRGDAIVATGFLVAGPWDEAGYTSASALLKERIREEELEDMIAAVGQTFLGFTVNCARCHDHKFDPVPQKDYYRFKAALQGVRHGERNALAAAELAERLERSATLNAQINELEDRLALLESKGRQRVLAEQKQRKPAAAPAPFACWTFEAGPHDIVMGIPTTLQGDARIVSGRLKLNGHNAFAKSAPLPGDIREKTLEAWVTLANLAQRGGSPLSLESKAQDIFDAIVFGEKEARKWMVGSSYFRRTVNLAADAETAASDEMIHVAITYHSSNRIAFYRNGILHGKSYVPEGDMAWLQTFPGTNSHLLFGLRHSGSKNGYLAGEIEEARLYDRALTDSEIRASFEAGPLTMTEEQIARNLTPEENKSRSALRAQLSKSRSALGRLPQVPRAYAAIPTNPSPTHVLARGDVEKKREPVTAGGLSVITNLSPEFDLPADAPESARRLRLAQWITDERNPLTARVMVNRIWHYHFGRGLATLPNDFGVNGGLPSHPDLLDWLAAEFVQNGWSIKHLHRLIMLSSVYQQRSTPARRDMLLAKDIDADNHLLWKFPMRRLEAEALRDALLSLGGNLNERLGGPGYRPFKVTVSGSNFYDPIDEAEPEFYRRTVYRMGVHSGKSAFLDSLDCPDPSTKTPARAVTTTPIQSLGLMNNPFVLRQARRFSERLQREAGGDLHSQVEKGYRFAFGRPPTAHELQETAALATEHGMDSVAWTLINASEFVYLR